MKRLGIYYATACYRDEQGSYYTSPGLGLYLDTMVKLFPFQIVLLAPVTTRSLTHLKYPLPEERVTVYELPYFETFLGAVKVRRALIQRLRGFSTERVDVMWLRYPAAYATELWRLSHKEGYPTFYEAVVDTVGLFETEGYGNSVVRWLALRVAQWHESEMRYISRSTPTFAVAQSLARKIGEQCEWIPSSTLTESDFFVRPDVAMHQPVQILYVGSLEPRKSVETLLEAAALLKDQEVCVELNIVGDGPDRERLQLLAGHLLGTVGCRFHGYIADRETLRELYRSADVFVLPSLSEGFPRVIFEAMAHGVPVVATAVSGIPDLVHHEHSGLLVPVRNPKALAEAIRRLIQDESLRHHIIEQGYAVARQHTVDSYLRRVVAFVKERTGVDLCEP